MRDFKEKPLGSVPTVGDFLEADDVLMNARADDSDNLQFPLRRAGLWLWGGVLGLLVLAASGRLIELTVFKHSYLVGLAQRSITSIDWQPAGRGIILDRTGQPLVRNENTASVVVMPSLLPRDEAGRRTLAERAAALLGREPAAFLDPLLKADPAASRPLVLEENIDEARTLFLTEALAGNSIIRLVPSFRRVYLTSPAFAHILGYTGKVSAAEVQDETATYLPIDIVGRSGLEASYESTLRGRHGQKLFRINAQGERLSPLGESPAVPGQSLVLTVDSELQAVLAKALERELKALDRPAGSAVALDPETGAVLALVSFPTFDNNIFGAGLDEASFANLANNPLKPLFNRAIGGQYPPGSSIKPVVGVAALTEKVIDPLTQIFVTGSITVTSVYDPSIKYVFKDWQAHGWVNFTWALAVSSNVYFYTVGGGFGDVPGLGVERLAKYDELFGLGSKLGIDLPTEAAGLVPTPSWKTAALGEPWYIGDTYHLAIGQGDLSVTPLQVAAYTAAIANGGTLYRPHLVAERRGPGEAVTVLAPEIIREIEADPAAFRYTQAGLRRAVTEGSARLLNSLSVAVAGKTGTAQPGGDQEPHGWFTGYAPYEAPQLALTILIENGGEGSRVAVPVAREVFTWYAEQRLKAP